MFYIGEFQRPSEEVHAGEGGGETQCQQGAQQQLQGGLCPHRGGAAPQDGTERTQGEHGGLHYRPPLPPRPHQPHCEHSYASLPIAATQFMIK